MYLSDNYYLRAGPSTLLKTFWSKRYRKALYLLNSLLKHEESSCKRYIESDIDLKDKGCIKTLQVST